MSGGTGPASPVVKSEPPEWDDLLLANPHHHQQSMSHPQQGRFGHMPSGSINPSELSTQSGGSYDLPHMGGPGQSMAGSFPMGGATGLATSNITDEELLGLGDLGEVNQTQPHGINTQQHNGRQNFERIMAMQHAAQQGIPQQMFSHTPAGEPMPSPYGPGYDYQAYQQAQRLAVQQAQQMSPHVRPMTAGNGHIMAQELTFANPHARYPLGPMMERKTSDSRSPMTPKTPAQNGFEMAGTPDSGSGGMSLPGHPHHGRLSGGPWDSNPASLQSMHSPMSPATHTGHSPFTGMMRGQKQHSPSGAGPASASVGGHPGVGPAYQTQEAKRRRRRESHNQVERRRRDNINERIQELSHLVPQHRLEDEKVRKHLATNGGPISPTLPSLGSAGSPGAGAAATSLLAGSGGRRATGPGTVTLGLPPDDKDKGPNKGDILNGSVGWTRDLMGALHAALSREDALRQDFARRDVPWPFQEAEADRRMRSELRAAVDSGRRHNLSFQYSRGPTSGLHVPGHTTVAGEPLSRGNDNNTSGSGGHGSGGGHRQAQASTSSAGASSGGGGAHVPVDQMSPQDLGPAASAGANANAPPQHSEHRGSADSNQDFWPGDDAFKEEDNDYVMQ